MSVTGAHHRVQEPGPAGPKVGFRVVSALLALAVAGCEGSATMNPVDWWHDLEGGRIAAARPPPPNADAPYPNLASVPQRPAPQSGAVRNTIASRLLTDRSSAQYAAANEPLPTSRPAAARPAEPATAPADQSQPMGATLAAASAPPPATTPPAPAPQPAPPPAAAATPFPSMPQAPPPPPNLPGVPAVTQPVPPPTAPPPALPLRAQGSVVAVVVPFSEGSAALAPAVLTALRQLAAQRGSLPIAVTGYGEAPTSEPATQAEALALAWARAQAISGALQSDGVPPAMLRLAALATGRGGEATTAR